MSTGPIVATVQGTGELWEFPAASADDVIDSLALVNQYLEVFDKAKKALQDLARDVVDDRGTYAHNGYLLRVTSVQRNTYDPLLLREVIEDEDTLAGFMELSKGRVDRYIKEHLAELGEGSTRLRQTMIPVGRPYSVVRLERLEKAA